MHSGAACQSSEPLSKPGASFPLTPTLCLGERENPRLGCDISRRSGIIRDGRQGTLSLRERVGVRGNRACLASSVLGCLSLIICSGAALNATAADTTNNVAELASRPDYREWTVGLDAGSTGAGVFGSWRFYDYLGVRAGFDYFQWTENNLSIADFRYSATARLLSEPLTLDIYPWKAHSFHISVGMLFNQNQLTGTSSGFGPITFAGHTFTFADMGVLNLKAEQQPVNPYLSIGGNFFYFDHAHHWALGGELGVAYTGDTTVSLTRTGGLVTSGPVNDAINGLVNHEQQKAQDWANQFKWFPVVKLMVTYSF